MDEPAFISGESAPVFGYMPRFYSYDYEARNPSKVQWVAQMWWACNYRYATRDNKPPTDIIRKLLDQWARSDFADIHPDDVVFGLVSPPVRVDRVDPALITAAWVRAWLSSRPDHKPAAVTETKPQTPAPKPKAGPDKPDPVITTEKKSQCPPSSSGPSPYGADTATVTETKRQPPTTTTVARLPLLLEYRIY